MNGGTPEGHLQPAIRSTNRAATLALSDGDRDDALFLVPLKIGAPGLPGGGEIPVGVALEPRGEAAQSGAFAAGLLEDAGARVSRRRGRHEADHLGHLIASECQSLVRHLLGCDSHRLRRVDKIRDAPASAEAA